MLFVFQDGAELEEPPDAKIEVVGDRGIPSPLYYRQASGPGTAGFELKLEVWDGIPVCSEVRLTGTRDAGVHVRVRDLKRVTALLEKSIEDWLSLVAWIPQDAPKGRRRWRRSVGNAEERRAAIKAIQDGRRPTRRKGSKHLPTVAKYFNSVTEARGEAVMRGMGVSMPTARRYIKQAREAGLIE